MNEPEEIYPVKVQLSIEDLLILRSALMTLIQELDRSTTNSKEGKRRSILKVGHLMGRLHALRRLNTGWGHRTGPRSYVITEDHAVTPAELGAAVARKWRRALGREKRQPTQSG